MRSSTPMVSHVFSSSPPSPPLLLLFHTASSLLFLCLFWQHTHAVYTLSTITGRRPRGPGES